MEKQTWAKVAQAGHEAKEREARSQLEAKRRAAFDFERQRRQEKDALRGRQTERLDKIEKCCTNIERALSRLKKKYDIIGDKDGAYDNAMSSLKSHLTKVGQSVETVLEAKRKEYRLVEECLQQITGFIEAKYQIFLTQREITNIGREYESEVGSLSLSQVDDTRIMDRANKLKAKKKELVEDYNTFNQSAKENAEKIDSLYDRSTEVLKLIEEKQG